jgi:single-strand DNA-binding protein
MTNEAIVSVAGYIATDPEYLKSKPGTAAMVKMRLAWTPRRFDRETNGWVDQTTSFVWVKCWRKLAENAAFSLSKGDSIVVTGPLTVSEYLAKDGTRRTSVEITANAIGHDLSRGVSSFRRQRFSNDPASQDAQSSEAEAAEAGTDRPDALDPGADTDSRGFDAAGGEPGDMQGGDLEGRHHEMADREMADHEMADPEASSPLASDVPEEEEALEAASAR